MASWLSDIVQALKNLGGTARYREIYDEVVRVRIDVPKSYKKIIQRLIQDHSSDSGGFKGKDDLFYPVYRLGAGVWSLRKHEQQSPLASDIEAPPPEKKDVQTYRILRDTSLVRELKRIHKNKCQICKRCLNLHGGLGYSEGHHLKQLGGDEPGPDIAANIIILCPNHHALCDYKAIRLELENIKLHPDHQIGQEYLDHHNSLYEQASQPDGKKK